MRLCSLLHSLPGVFVTRLMLPFCVARRCGAVGVRGLFVQFRSSLMRIVVHGSIS